MTGELFTVPGVPATTVAAMTDQIAAWQSAGQAVAPIVRRTLLDQAHAVDLARAARRPTAITGATRVMLELLQGFGLAKDAPAAPDSAFDAFLAAVNSDA